MTHPFGYHRIFYHDFRTALDYDDDDDERQPINYLSERIGLDLTFLPVP